MPIRRSIKKRKRIWYHIKYGSVTNPPLGPNSEWPNGSPVTISDIPRYRGKPIVIGWICHQRGTKMYGLWIATRIGVAKPRLLDHSEPVPDKKLPFIDTWTAVPGDYEFVQQESENKPTYRLVDILLDAFADKHDLLL